MIAPLAMLATASTDVARIDGFAIDWQGGPRTPSVVASIGRQVELVEASPVSTEAMAFFRAQTITVDRPGAAPAETGAGPARAGPNGIFFARGESPPDNPVLLHELMHRWHYARLPGGVRNPVVLRFYRRAVASGRWPEGSYMLKNPQEFWAMTASTVLHGHVARPPFTRQAVKEKAPQLYAFIVAQFGYRGP